MKRCAWGLLVCCCLTAGCGDVFEYIGQQFPTINDIEVSNAVHRTQPIVRTGITDPEDPESSIIVTEVLLAWRSTLEENESFVEYGTMTETSSDGSVTEYEGFLPALALGSYEVRVQARVKMEPQTPDQPPLDEQEGLLLVKTQPFNVAASGKVCFTFADDLQGWTFDGIYDGGDAGNPVTPTCTLGFHDPNFNAAAMGFACLPNEEPESGFWSQDFISPDLEDITEWQDLQNVSFRISSQISTNPTVEFKIQPILSYRDAQGTEHTIPPVDAAGERIFYDVVGTRTISWSPPLPPESTVTRLRIRVFVEHLMTVGETVCRLHAVCPSGPWLTSPTPGIVP